MTKKYQNQRPRFCQSELFKQLVKNRPIILVDVGARGGIDRKWDVFGERAIKVIGCEPEPEECKRLNKVSKSNHRYFPVALFNKKGEVTINLTRNLACSSIFEPNSALIDRFFTSEEFEVKDSVLIRCNTLDDILMENNFRDIDFIKLDTQGTELQILQGAERTLPDVFGIDIEVEFSPLYQGQPLFADVDIFLRERGFTLFDLQIPFGRKIRKELQNQRRYSKGQVFWTNALYFKDFVSKDGLMKIGFQKAIKTIAIAELYGFNDFALELLDHYLNRKLIDASIYSEIRKRLIMEEKVSSEVKLYRNIRRDVGEFLNERFPFIYRHLTKDRDNKRHQV